MNQPTVFVTYVPKGALDRRAAMAPGRKPDAMMAVMAGIMAVGGTVAALTPAMSQAAAPHGMITRVVLPPAGKPAHTLLTVRTTEPIRSDDPGNVAKAEAANRPPNSSKLAFAPAGIRSATDESTGRRSDQRRDLAGFLADQGLTLVTSRAAMPIEGDGAAPEVGRGELPVLAATQRAIAAVPEDQISELVPPLSPIPETAQSYPDVFVADRSIGAVTMRGDQLHLAYHSSDCCRLSFPDTTWIVSESLLEQGAFVSLQALGDAGIHASL